MTVQQIADYAMRYLDNKEIGADYSIVNCKLYITSDKGRAFFDRNRKKAFVTNVIHQLLILSLIHI